MERCGPVQMFHKLRVMWGESRDESADEVADKVKHFFNCYCRNRHKCKERQSLQERVASL